MMLPSNRLPKTIFGDEDDQKRIDRYPDIYN